jgi:hypothetical protein
VVVDSQQLDQRAEIQLDRLILLDAMTKTEMGKAFLTWLCLDLCGWGRSSQTSEQSAAHDIWLSVRRYVPLQALAEIEYSRLAKDHVDLRTLLEEKPLATTKDFDEWTQQ